MKSIFKGELISYDFFENTIKLEFENDDFRYIKNNKENYQLLNRKVGSQIIENIMLEPSGFEIIMDPISDFYEENKGNIFIGIATFYFICMAVGINYPEERYEMLEYIFQGMMIAPNVYCGFKIPQLINKLKFNNIHKSFFIYIENAEKIKKDLETLQNADNFEELFNFIKLNCYNIGMKLDFLLHNNLIDSLNLDFIIINEISEKELLFFIDYISRLQRIIVYSEYNITNETFEKTRK